MARTYIGSTDLIGEALNYYVDTGIRIAFKQGWEVTQDTVNFKWKVKTALYVKIETLSGSDWGFSHIYMYTGNNVKVLSSNSSTQTPGLYITNTGTVKAEGVTMSGNALNSYVKIMEEEYEYVNVNGRQRILLHCGHYGPSDFDESIYVWLTLPSFSGVAYKINGSYKGVQTWVKVNGTWKQAIPYIKVNGEWVKADKVNPYIPS